MRKDQKYGQDQSSVIWVTRTDKSLECGLVGNEDLDEKFKPVRAHVEVLLIEP